MPKKFISFLFLVAVFSLIISSFFPQELVHKYFYQAVWFKILWAILCIGLFVGIINFLKRRFFTFALIYFALILIIFGGFLASLLGEEGFIELKEGQTVNGFWIEDDLFQPLDFSIHLKDFSVEFYPAERKGMQFVKSYKSSVGIGKDGNLLKEGIIEVNKPLKFGGYWFYQYGYDPEYPEQTLLQVVKDPGLSFVYIGYLFLLLGILTSFRKIWKI